MRDQSPQQEDQAAVKRWNDYARQVNDGTAVSRKRGIHITLFEHYSIRRMWEDGEWWYSCVDCMVPLSTTSNPTRYWSDLKKKMLKEEEVHIYDSIVYVKKLPDKKGRMTPTDCANTEGLLRIIQSINSPKAAQFKAWLARVGKLVMDDMDEHDKRVSHRTRLYYFDKELHDEATERGVESRMEHIVIDDANWAGLYDTSGELAVLRLRPGTLPGALPEAMGSAELASNIFQRAMTTEMVRQRDLIGVEPIARAAMDVGTEVRMTIERLGGVMPEDMPQYPPLLPGEWMPPDHPSLIQWDEATDEAPPVEGASQGGEKES
ncbi:MAG: hypothetical protein H0X24_01780 [Ktedonobacterales bacterium]|nr:hypothetical protein [Ktedonobacterales bacterium]